jgi:hypothetical protein
MVTMSHYGCFCLRLIPAFAGMTVSHLQRVLMLARMGLCRGTLVAVKRNQRVSANAVFAF